MSKNKQPYSETPTTKQAIIEAIVAIVFLAALLFVVQGLANLPNLQFLFTFR